MKKYLSFFCLRFTTSLQYRMAAFFGLITQFVWGGMLILAYRAFYRSQPDAFPMTFQATATYIWLQQAFLALFQSWGFEGEILETVQTGNVAYELCRPISIYDMWYTRTVAHRASSVLLRCWPILLLGALLPAPYGIAPPVSAVQLLWAVLSLVLGTLVAAAIVQLVYFSGFFVLDSYGIRAAAAVLVEFLQGAIIPLPFLPDGVRRVVELFPFASAMNAPLRIYAGDIAGEVLYRTVALQVFWIVVLVAAGKALEARAVKKTVVQGG